MTDGKDPAGRRGSARAFVEKALQAEAKGDLEKADDLIEQATKVDPDETVEVLQEQRDQSGPTNKGG